MSTRRVGACVKGLLGEAVSASTVSRVCTALSRDVAAFHDRPLSDHHRCVFLDGLAFKVRGASRSRRKVLLCAMGVTLAGRREIIDFRLADSESEATWTKFLDDLYHRGLLGHPLRLIITDGNPGLLAALEVVYPFTPHQRCWFHKMQNVVKKVRKRNQEAVVSGAQRIYEAHRLLLAMGQAVARAGAQGGGVHRERHRDVVGPLPRAPRPSGHPAHDKPH